MLRTQSVVDSKRHGSAAIYANFELGCLTLIVVLAFCLRFFGIWRGYPLIVHSDEPYIEYPALEMLKRFDLNPHGFTYPSLIIYLQCLLAALTAVYKYVIHGVRFEDIPKVDFFVVGRAVAALASSLSIVFVWLIGRKIANAIVGLLAAGIVAASPLHVRLSYLVTVDIWTAIFTVVVFYFCTRIYENGARRDYLLAGVFVGLAAGSKYTAAISLVSVLVAHGLGCHNNNNNQKALWFDRRLLYCAVVSIAAFFATSPYVILDHSKFFSDLGDISSHYTGGHPGAEAVGDHSYGLAASALLSSGGIGATASILALAGIILAAYRTNPTCLMLVGFTVTFFLFVGKYKVFFPRNVACLIPPLALLAAYSINEFLLLFNGSRTARLAVASLVFAAIALPLLYSSANETISANATDTRWVSLQWIQANLPAGSKIAREKYTPPVEEFSPGFRVVDLGVAGAYYNLSEIDNNIDYVILSNLDYGRFFAEPIRYARQVGFYSDFFQKNTLIYELKPDGKTVGPTIRIFKGRFYK